MNGYGLLCYSGAPDGYSCMLISNLGILGVYRISERGGVGVTVKY